MNYDDLVSLVDDWGMTLGSFDCHEYRDLIAAIQELQRDASMLEAILKDAGIVVQRGEHGITWERR